MSDPKHVSSSEPPSKPKHDRADSSPSNSLHSWPGSLAHSQQINVAFGSLPNSVLTLNHGGSTLAHTVFNAVNVLAGIAILSLPFAFKYCGWFLGISIFLFCLILTNYTAKTLVKCMDLDPSCILYADIAELAFGKKARVVIGLIFLFDLFNVSVALLILASDSFKSLYPNFDLNLIKLAAFVIITPLTYMPIRLLSYTSVLGIISVTSLVIVIMYDGFSKHYAPGSLWEPMSTSIWPTAWLKVPLTFGLIGAGFSGHAVFPSLYRDMIKPQRIKPAVDISYAITVAIYLSLAITGYLMFGSSTMPEITQNIIAIPGYNIVINSVIVWFMVVNPLSKYPLTLNPVNVAAERNLLRISFIQDHIGEIWVRIILRPIISGLILLTAIIFPRFDRLVSLLGAFCSFSISGVIPIVVHLKLFGHSLSTAEYLWNVGFLAITLLLAVSGTIWTFIPSQLLENS